ncbi:MAG: hypothetical protein KDA22_15290, partial [Phycisphaerales bacterium]|nr:hypothetical protein [Phycisphaerales bacterium]
MRSPTDAFDELAALFLTEDPDASSSAAAVLPAVQLLVVGHAPVMAGLWLAQYADLLGRQCGPTGLIRFDETEVSLEILRAGGRRVGLDGSPTLHEAIRSAARVVERWVVRADPRLPHASLLNAGADQIVLMTGADARRRA